MLDDEVPTLGKVCKSWDSVARNSILSSKVDNPKLLKVTAWELHREILRASFRRGHDYEITSVQKAANETWGWIISTTPNQASKIIQHLVPYQQENLHVITPLDAQAEKRAKGEGLTEEELKKKNSTMLCLYGLHKLKKVEETKKAIKEVFGEKNILGLYFLGQVGDLHKGSVNVQCLNPIVYRQFLGKTKVVLGKHVVFTPHPRSLEGSAPPTKEEQESFGFNNISAVIVDTLEATKNAPSSSKEKRQVTEGDIEAIVQRVVREENSVQESKFNEKLELFEDKMSRHAQKLTSEVHTTMQGQMEDV